MGEEKEKEKAVHLDRNTVQSMKEAGIPKPEEVSHASWNQPGALHHPKYQTIAYLAAMGHKQKEIGETVGMTQPEISNLLQSDRMKFEIKRIVHKLFGKDAQKRFKEILPAAIDTAEELLMSPDTKPAIRASLAQDFMDRALGKPKQTIEHEGSAIRDLFNALDQRKNDAGRVIDAEVLEPRRVIESGEPIGKVEPDPKPLDAAAEWVNNNLKGTPNG